MTTETEIFKEKQRHFKEFRVTKSLPIKELKCHLTEYTHLPTGAQVMHIANDDPENLFCLSFRTYPDSSNGVAHILEHTVLCGSKKYPIKDPFFLMMRRSLNTFMNAMTSSDFTCYPAASQVEKDFYNLLEVYLDAVFYPNLNELSFLQEGHRLEFSQTDNPNSPLEYKGIVFNEMKGAMNAPTTRLYETINASLFTDLTYRFNSGGDPAVIPELTYKQFIDFHKKYYNPSRCLFYFYGNFPIEKHLNFIAEKVLNNSTKKKPLSPLPKQKRFDAPRFVKGTFPASPKEQEEKQALIASAWLTCPIIDQLELTALSVLEVILMDTDASPLKKALLQSDLCKQASSHLEAEVSEAPFLLILQGCRENSMDAIQQLIQNTLKTIIKEGIPKKAIANALHQVEFHRSEISGDHYPFGLILFFRAGPLKQHDAPAEEALVIHTLFKKIEEKLADNPRYFESLIEKHLLNNPHAVNVEMTPNANLSNKETQKEQEKLKAIQENLTELDKEQIIKKTKELAALQKKLETQSKEVLPKINLTDVPRKSRDYPLSQSTWQSFNLNHHSCFTNEIVYADITFSLPQLAPEELTHLSLFTQILPQIGAGGRNYKDNLEFIQANTGGVSSGISLNIQANNYDSYHPTLTFQGKALHKKAPQLFQLLREMFQSPELTDKTRLKEIIHKKFTSMQLSLSQNSLKYALNLATSTLNIPSKISNTLSGLDYFKEIRRLATNLDQEVDGLTTHFLTLKEKILCFKQADLTITSDTPFFEQAQKESFWGLDQISPSTPPLWEEKLSLTPLPSQGRLIPSPVAFTAKALKSVPYTHEDAPSLAVLAYLFNNLILHQSLREQGGAYGGGAVNSSSSGLFYFYAFRDPNLTRTLMSFNQAVQHILSGNFTSQDIEEAMLEVIQGLDNPISPGSRGAIAHGWLLTGKTLPVRQAFRDKLLSLTKEQIITAAKQHIAPQMDKSITVSFAGQEFFDRENKQLTDAALSPLKILEI